MIVETSLSALTGEGGGRLSRVRGRARHSSLKSIDRVAYLICAMLAYFDAKVSTAPENEFLFWKFQRPDQS